MKPEKDAMLNAFQRSRKRYRVRFLKPLPSKNTRYRDILAFDCETYGPKNKFVLGSVYSDKVERLFHDRDEMKEFLINYRTPASAWRVATNLEFDFFTLFDKDDMACAELNYRKSNLISVKYYGKRGVIFIDSNNYGRLSVKGMRKVTGLSKMMKPVVGRCDRHQSSDTKMEDVERCPDCDRKIWRMPETDEEWRYLETYNMMDSRQTWTYVDFLFNSFCSLGIPIKKTIAGCSLAYWRMKSQPFTLFTMHPRYYKMIYEAYYGGRCEALKRGYIERRKYKLFDFNSAYWKALECMSYPNPNIFRFRTWDSRYYRDYEGVTCCTISSPAHLDIPLLPWRIGPKVFFPLLERRKGWWSNIELRKAEEIGYVVHKIHKSLYFPKTYDFFGQHYRDMYKHRKELKSKKDPMEYIFKILGNSLYGRFALKYFERERLVHSGFLASMKPDREERFRSQFSKEDPIYGTDFIRYTATDWSSPPPEVVPIFSCYATAKARLLLYDHLDKHVAYMDTDSVVCSKDIEWGNELGQMKLEFPIDYGIIFRPKMYGLRPTDEWLVKNPDKSPDYVKIKGRQLAMSLMELEHKMDISKGKMELIDKKFMRFKASLRSKDHDVNEIISDFKKSFSLEDDKRSWPSRFDSTLQDSEPLRI